MSLENLFNDNFRLVGEYGGDLWDIYRPDYSVTDNSPVLVHSSKRFRCDPVGYKFAEPGMDGVQYYDIFGDRSLLRAGDIMKLHTPDGMTPSITIAHLMPMKAVTGFRTDRICKIMESVTDSANIIHDNVYFDFLNLSYPGSAVNRNLERSLRLPSARVVLFNRPQIYNLRVHLVEIDSAINIIKISGAVEQFQRKWIVESIDFGGTQMVLSLRDEA